MQKTSDWSLHLYATQKMLNLFAATGHIHYAKSARPYLQTMQNFPISLPWLYEQFSLQRSDRFWAGLWTDLTIEQILIRSIKNRGGLATGRGMTEEVRLIWIHSSHQSAAVHNQMTMITRMKHKTSEQHMELGRSRNIKDFKDLLKISNWFEQFNPFSKQQTKLYSLSTGYTAEECDETN